MFKNDKKKYSGLYPYDTLQYFLGHLEIKREKKQQRKFYVEVYFKQDIVVWGQHYLVLNKIAT